MTLQKPEISVCIDGKAHSWMVVAEGNSQEEGFSLEHRWCQKCGCLTQVGIGSDSEPVVAVDGDGSPHLATPKILAALIK